MPTQATILTQEDVEAEASATTRTDVLVTSTYKELIRHYKAGGKNECGGCTLVKGPIHPQGYCNSWAAKG